MKKKKKKEQEKKFIDRCFAKEFEKAKARKAHPDYLSYIYALSLIDGSHKEHQKAMHSYSKFFTEIVSLPESKKLRIVIGKAWANGFNFAYKNSDKLNQAKKEIEKQLKEVKK